MLADLDADQRRAVTTESELVAVIAGAGSGKTRVLTRRIAYRVATGTADLGHTVVLTFTREAAGELRRRLPRLGLTERITAGTFHSVAQQMLRQRWLDQDQSPRTIITDRKRIVGDVMGPERPRRPRRRAGLGDGPWDRRRRRTRRRYVGASDGPSSTRAGSARHSSSTGPRSDVAASSTSTTSSSSRSTRWTSDAEFAAATRWRFRHVLVDEAQDLNPLQHRLVDLLRLGVDDLYLVGDPAQSIYGFNGSDPTILRDVSDRFPGIEVVRLPVNHRCTPQIVQIGAQALRVR